MKQIILLLIGTFFLVNTASAYYNYGIQSIKWSPDPVYEGDTVNLTIKCVSVSHGIFPMDSGYIEIIDRNTEKRICNITVSNGVAYYTIQNIEYRDTPFNYSYDFYKFQLHSDNGSIEECVWVDVKVYKKMNVPEFPTIAAPIAILLGLMVVFRKKN